MSLAQRLTNAMAIKGISQAELARACNVKPPSVHGWLSGKAKFLRGENLLLAAAALGVSQQWLATGEGAMQADAGSAPVATAPSQPPALSQALEVVVAALAKVPMDSRKAVADDMGLLAMAPDSSETLARLAASLAPARQETRLPGTESHEFQPPTPPSMFLKNTEKT